MSIATEVLVIVFLAVANGLLSMSEIALVSARKVRLQRLAGEGHRGAAAAHRLAEEPARFLSTVQIGITLVGILAGVFGGATLADQLSSALARVPGLREHSDPIAVGVVVLGITYLTLVIGELVPKQVALASPEAIAVVVARPVRLLSLLATPLVVLLDGSTRLLLRLLPRRHEPEPPITEEELTHLLEQGTSAGVFEVGEQEIVARAVRLGELTVGEVATPRAAIVALNADDTADTNNRKIAESPYWVFPVYESTPDRLLGVVSVKDLWREAMVDSNPDLRALVRDPLYLPENISVLRAFERIRSTGRQVGVVLDEHGGIDGLVTLHDLLEALVGTLPTGQEERLVVQRTDGSWLVDGLLGVEDLAHLVGWDRTIRPLLGDARTVGGLVMERLGRLPEEGDRFEVSGCRFEVLDMDHRRVDKVLVERALGRRARAE